MHWILSLLLFLRYATHINYHLQFLFGCWIWMNSQEKVENLCKNQSVNGTTKMWLTMKFKLNYFENEQRRTHSQYMHTVFTWFKIAVQNQKHVIHCLIGRFCSWLQNFLVFITNGAKMNNSFTFEILNNASARANAITNTIHANSLIWAELRIQNIHN